MMLSLLFKEGKFVTSKIKQPENKNIGIIFFKILYEPWSVELILLLLYSRTPFRCIKIPETFKRSMNEILASKVTFTTCVWKKETKSYSSHFWIDFLVQHSSSANLLRNLKNYNFPLFKFWWFLKFRLFSTFNLFWKFQIFLKYFLENFENGCSILIFASLIYFQGRRFAWAIGAGGWWMLRIFLRMQEEKMIGLCT